MGDKGNGNRKGVSEVIGYLLTFAIVVTIVSVIYASGMPVVEQTKESSAITSMETVFLTLQGNMKKVAIGQSPVRTMKLGLVKGTMSAQENAGNITIANGTYSTSPIRFGNIEYTLGTQKLVYENGAVIEHSLAGNIIVSEPLIFFMNYSSDNADVFISVINASGTLSTSGVLSEMQMGPYNVTRDTSDIVYMSSTPADPVTITINSSYAHAWSMFLNNAYKETFGGEPISGFDDANNFCWLTLSSCNVTLISHNVTVS
jgi:flagellin-like protein